MISGTSSNSIANASIEIITSGNVNDKRIAIYDLINKWHQYRFLQQHFRIHNSKLSDWDFAAMMVTRAIREDSDFDLFVLSTDEAQGLAICSHKIGDNGQNYYSLRLLLAAPWNLSHPLSKDSPGYKLPTNGVGTVLISAVVNYMSANDDLVFINLEAIPLTASSVDRFYRSRMFEDNNLTPDKFKSYLHKYTPPVVSNWSQFISNDKFIESATTDARLHILYESKMGSAESNKKFLTSFFENTPDEKNYYLDIDLVDDLLAEIFNNKSKEEWLKFFRILFQHPLITYDLWNTFYRFRFNTVAQILEGLQPKETSFLAGKISLDPDDAENILSRMIDHVEKYKWASYTKILFTHLLSPDCKLLFMQSEYKFGRLAPIYEKLTNDEADELSRTIGLPSTQEIKQAMELASPSGWTRFKCVLFNKVMSPTNSFELIKKLKREADQGSKDGSDEVLRTFKLR